MLECRKNGLQLRRGPNCFQPLLLLRVKEAHKFREKILLYLRNLLLQRVDLDYQHSHIGCPSRPLGQGSTRREQQRGNVMDGQSFFAATDSTNQSPDPFWLIALGQQIS